MELKRMMQGLIAALENHQALSPIHPKNGTALKPSVPQS
jgi:hypothetical protein